MTVAIIDDEPLARRGIRRLIEELPDFRVVGEAGTGAQAYDLIVRTRPDAVLVDVQMPDGSGLQAIKRLPAADRPLTIFVTAHESYAVEAFGVRAVDYVLKPFADARLVEALDRARQAHRLRAAAGDRDDAQPSAAGQIIVRSLGRTDVVPIDELQWIEAVGYYVRLHTGGAALLHRESMDSLAMRLDPARFVRVHRSTIVRLDAIRQTRRTRTGSYQLFLATGHRVAVSRSGWTLLRSALRSAGVPHPPAGSL